VHNWQNNTLTSETAERCRYPSEVTPVEPAMKRFSLRTLLIATAVVAVIMALPLRRAVVQKRGRDWVATQKGHVNFSHKYNAVTDVWDHRSKLLAPDWLVGALGIDFFDSVDSVVLDNTEVKDLSPITDLQSLRYLAIIIEIDDKLDFAPLADLPKLRHLYLDYTNITAERLEKLRALLPHVRVDATNQPPPEKKR
jgi:hypothetical protein